MITTPARLNLSGQVVQDLGCRIVGGELEPGEPLPAVETLCEQLGVSRTVIREAVKSLAARGLVDSRPKRGTVVRPAEHWNFLDPLVLAWQEQTHDDGRHLFHLTELRQAIEPAAAAMAAERAPDEALRRIEEAARQLADSVDDVEAFLAADLRFHTEILHATGNPLFAPVANVIGAYLGSSLRVTNRQPADNRASVPIHKKVARAICDRAPARARAAMKSHLDHAAARLQRALDSSTSRR
jgi:DNA-binding FadR family transcriptional regulator